MHGLSFEDTQRAVPEYQQAARIEDLKERLKARLALDLKYSVQEDMNKAFMAGCFIIDPMLLKRDDLLQSMGFKLNV